MLTWGVGSLVWHERAGLLSPRRPAVAPHWTPRQLIGVPLFWQPLLPNGKKKKKKFLNVFIFLILFFMPFFYARVTARILHRKEAKDGAPNYIYFSFS